MAAPRAELSSLATSLAELIARVGHLAEGAAAERDDDTAAELFAVERALTGAQRRLVRVADPPRGHS